MKNYESPSLTVDLETLVLIVIHAWTNNTHQSARDTNAHIPLPQLDLWAIYDTRGFLSKRASNTLKELDMAQCQFQYKSNIQRSRIS